MLTDDRIKAEGLSPHLLSSSLSEKLVWNQEPRSVRRCKGSPEWLRSPAFDEWNLRQIIS